tara:strand:+ start:483 stop:857 length:375 start_codon:yes stop_codon:yes gene_type:complete
MDQVVITWTILSHLRAGDKLALTFESVAIDRKGLFTGIRRSIRGDSRESLQTFIPRLVDQTLRQDFSQDAGARTAVINGAAGLLTLRTTYQADVCFIAEFERAVSKLKRLIDTHEDFLDLAEVL